MNCNSPFVRSLFYRKNFMCCDCDDDYDAYFDYYGTPRNTKMSVKNFTVDGGTYYETLEDAITYASKRANKTGEDHKVYQAIKLVATTTPNVVVTDIVLK